MNKWAALLIFLTFGQAFAQNSIGSFTYNNRQDAFTDQDKSSIFTFDTLNSTASRPAQLFIRCNDKAVEILVATYEFLDSKDPVAVDYRFDQKPAKLNDRWNVSTNGLAAFVPSEQIVSFIDAVLSSNTLNWRVRNYRGVQYAYAFNLNSSADALSKLKCITAMYSELPKSTNRQYIDTSIPYVSLEFAILLAESPTWASINRLGLSSGIVRVIGRVITFKPGETNYVISGVAYPLPAPIERRLGLVLIPASFLSDDKCDVDTSNPSIVVAVCNKKTLTLTRY
jgi:hypothetical protein